MNKELPYNRVAFNPEALLPNKSHNTVKSKVLMSSDGEYIYRTEAK